MSDSRLGAAPTGGIDYIAVEESPPFQDLKRRQRSFVFPLAVAFLLWYFVYVLLSSFATDFMAQRAWGDVTVGLLFGLGQFVTTFVITMTYVWYANKRLDPRAEAIRDELEAASLGDRS
ncbi:MULTISPECIES: DUF485 domain-containing protein [unclassified Microbacterium]|uniref:DUF485 domain-containing protein n=1 Tax=unclassified Microbacterium TaxID=2609290 RepID=UPI003746C714